MIVNGKRTVGYRDDDGTFRPESEHDTAESANARVAELNAALPEPAAPAPAPDPAAEVGRLGALLREVRRLCTSDEAPALVIEKVYVVVTDFENP